MAKISKAERKARILELYKNRGYSYLGIQKVYKVSSKTIAKIVKGIVIKCSNCGTLKSKGRFHAHHPDPTNENYTIPLCASCHVKHHIEKREQDKFPKPIAAVKPGMTILPQPPRWFDTEKRSRTRADNWRITTTPERPDIGKVIWGLGLIIESLARFHAIYQNHKRRQEATEIKKQ